MAQKRIITLIDDLDGSDADETVKFTLDGQDYAIDLSDTNAGHFRAAMQSYISAARTTQNRQRRSLPKRTTKVDTKTVRSWAKGQGIEINARGRIPENIIDRYLATQP